MRVPNRMAATENPTECLSLDRTEQSVLILFDHFCSSSTCRESFIGEKIASCSGERFKMMRVFLNALDLWQKEMYLSGISGGGRVST